MKKASGLPADQQHVAIPISTLCVAGSYSTASSSGLPYFWHAQPVRQDAAGKIDRVPTTIIIKSSRAPEAMCLCNLPEIIFLY